MNEQQKPSSPRKKTTKKSKSLHKVNDTAEMSQDELLDLIERASFEAPTDEEDSTELSCLPPSAQSAAA
jgi:hypothetical protein